MPYNNNISPELVKDKIIILGVTADSLKDFVNTPLDRQKQGNNQPTPGVVVHANITAQILDAGLNYLCRSHHQNW